MKVKELLAKYKGYQVFPSGYPGFAPFTCMPEELNRLHGKAWKRAYHELEVKGYKVINKPTTSIDITHLFLGGKKRPNHTYKGTLYIYLKSDKPL